MRQTILVAALLALPGCVFYFESDDEPAPPDAILVPAPDAAGPQPDANPGDGACSVELTCPLAGVNRVSICGRILDVENDQAAPVDLQAYDALEWAGSPFTATPLAFEDKTIDECGRFRFHNLQRPSLGFVALVTDDPGDADAHAPAAVTFPVSSAQVLNRARTYAIRHATDAQWTATAGLDGESFVTRGALLTVFLDADGNPVEGVAVTEGGATEPINDYYFANANPNARTTIDPRMAATGPNGSALKIDSVLVEHSGSGGEPPGCTWSSTIAASVPGTLFVAIRSCE
jgi:hypothetical protein